LCELIAEAVDRVVYVIEPLAERRLEAVENFPPGVGLGV
jgi:hypothetical protein